MCSPHRNTNESSAAATAAIVKHEPPIPPLSVSRGRYLISPMSNPSSESIERSPAAEISAEPGPTSSGA